MKKSAPLTMGLGDALRAAGVTRSSGGKGTQRESRDTTDKRVPADLERDSESLDLLHKSIEHAAEGRGGQRVRNGAALATMAAQHGLICRVRPSESAVADAIIEDVAALMLSGGVSFGSGDLLRALACLLHDEASRNRIVEILVEGMLQGLLPEDPTRWPAVDSKQRRLLERLPREDIAAKVSERKRIALYEEAKAERDAIRVRREAIQARCAERRSLQQRLEPIQSELYGAPGGLSIFVPPLAEADLKLLLAWGNRPSMDRITRSEARKQLGDHEFVRLYSARAAEHAAIRHFQSLGHAVLDTSITQIQRGGSDWRTHDLVAGTRRVDVKCARQSFSHPGRYSEYFVPRFKTDRRTGADVSVAAVFARYRTADQCADGERIDCTILGLVDQQQLRQLAHWVNTSFEGRLSASNFDPDAHLPGWCFEYSEEQYGSRARAMGKLVDLLKNRDNLSVAAEIPAAMLSLVDEDAAAPFLGQLPGPARDTRRSLAALRASVGISRRSVFLWIIGQTLLRVDSTDTAWQPRDLGKALFGRGEHARMRPLGLADPLGYIFEIIEAMQTLWEKGRDRLRSFTRFHFRGPGIISGIDQVGVEVTILAYCGGWHCRDDGTPFLKCGMSPLVLGQDKSCPRCRRLVCHACGSCSQSCGESRSPERVDA